jgi:predicted nucleotidyltransferase
MTELPFWERNLIYRVRSGSRAYGLARPDSDEDTRGVCIPPVEYLLGLQTFEQHEDETQNHTVFALAKFVRLALDANPNIIETLYTDPQHVLCINRHGERLVAARSLFLSRRVGERFSGYAIDQLQRMERHHRWLVDPPASPPKPEEFGARDVGGRYRWPHSDAERAYRAAAKHWGNYQAWLRNRNPARAELEARYGYDTKHAMHLLRLLRMGEEILREGVVRVLRPDAEWLLMVRNGALTYDQVLTYAAEHKARLAATTAHSPLPEEPDEKAADRLLIELQTEYLFGGDAASPADTASEGSRGLT